MRILFVCRFLPHPDVRDSGGQDQYHYITSLREQHSVSLISFVTPDQKEAVAIMRDLCDEVVPVPYRPHALLPRLWRAGWRQLLPRVYGRVISLRYRACLRDLLSRGDFDVAVVDGMMAPYGYLLKGTDTKRVLDEIDIYSVVAYHLFRNERHPFLRLYALLDWLRTLVFELHYVRTYDGIVVRSEKDRIVLQDYVPHQRIAVIPPWFEGLTELQAITPQRPVGNNLLFVGAMNLPANIEAVQYFVRDVLPLIRRQIPDVKFYIVGSAPSPSVRRLHDEEEGVIVVGEVKSLKPYYEKCAVNVVPLLRGGGVIVKTLNGLAAGRPTVATLLGNSGTGAQAGRDLLVVRNSPDAFATAVIRLLSEESLWTRIAQAGQRFVAQAYDWSTIANDLADFLQSVVRDQSVD